MHSHHPRLRALLNLLLILSLLLPGGMASARPTTPSGPPQAEQSQEPVETSTPVQKETPVTPSPSPTQALELPTTTPPPTPTPTIAPTTPPQASPTPPPAQETGEAPALELLLSAANPEYLPGESSLLLWQVKGWTAELRDLLLEFHLPEELTPLASDELAYDARSGVIQVPVASAEGQLSLLSSLEAKGALDIQAILYQGKLESDVLIRIDQAQLTLQESGLNQVKKEGGEVLGFAERVTVSFPAGAADTDLEVRVRRPIAPHRPATSLSGDPFEILAMNPDSAAEVHLFDKPLTITFTYDPQRLEGPEEQVRLYTYDPLSGNWSALPSQVDTQANQVSAQVDHLSIFDAATEGWQTSQLARIQDFQVAGFSGAATYQAALWTPPGPGGLQPSLGLHYNSQVVDAAIARQSQASWVGMGWSLEIGSIERDMHGTEDTGDDTFTLNAGGISSLLLKDSAGNYHTADESFWKVTYNSASDSWTAIDKQGNVYAFGESANGRAHYPAGLYDPQCQGITPNVTWRWGLTSLRNVYSKALTYTYNYEAQWVNDPCQANMQYSVTTALYPQRISYPDSPYAVEFILEQRSDYETAWTGAGGIRFFQQSRLKEVRLLNGTNLLRSYRFTYATNPQIYPNILYNQTSPTLTLTQVQEFDGNGNSLPALSFSYGDNLHLTQVSNGYGGGVQLAYQNPPWHDTYQDEERTISDSGLCHYQSGQNQWEPLYIAGYNGGSAWCETNAQGQNPQLYISGAAYLGLPAWMIQPGATFSTRFSAINRWGSPIEVKVGLITGLGETIGASASNLADGQSASLSGYPLLPAQANTVHLYLYCSGKCLVNEAAATLTTTRYTVQTRTLSEQVSGESYLYRYNFDEAATNDDAHSSWAASGATLYTPEGLEYRGHAMSRELAPDGRATLTFYHQDDARRGRAHTSLVFASSFYDDFEQGALNLGEWDTAQPLERLLGDAALKVSAGSSGVVRRLNYNLQDGQALLVQFYLDANGEADLGISSGSGSDYRRWGVSVVPGNGLAMQTCTAAGVCSNKATLLPEYKFPRQKWYVLLLAIDAQSFLARVWQRDNPEVVGRYEEKFVSGRTWRFFLSVRQGSAWLDTYQEGYLYTLSHTQQVAESRDTQWSNYADLRIQWVYVAQEKQFDFNGDGEWVGRQTSYTYADYGNRKHSLEQAWDPVAEAWRDLRLAVEAYYPNTAAGVYLVGLPGVHRLYECPPNSLNGNCSSAYPDNPPMEWLRDSTWYLYDGASRGDLPSTSGKPSGLRRLLYFENGQARYADERWTSDDWGNRLSHSRYTQAGSWEQYGLGVERKTELTYENTYHAYLMRQVNPSGLATDWSYDTDCGLPASETGPNGSVSTISATYDDFCRLRTLVRPGDSQAYPTVELTYLSAGSPPYWVEVVQRLVSGTSQVSRTRRYYDGFGRLLQTQSVAARLYDGACQAVDNQLDTCDVVVDYTYNAAGQVTRQSLPYALDSQGGSWRDQQDDKPSVVTQYDVLGRTLSVIAADGTSTQWQYGDSGSSAPDGYAYQEVRIEDALTHTTYQRSDLLGRLRKVIPPEGPGVSYTYDVEDQLTLVVRGGVQTSLSYDLGGRKLSLSDPDMGAWAYTYDPLGNLVTQSDGRGCLATLSYDSDNRLTGKSYSGTCSSTPAVTYQYDAYVTGSNYGRGLRTGMSDASGSTSWKYDTRGRLTEELKTISGSGSFKTQWGYNAADQVTWMKYPGGNASQVGEQVSYTYHTQGALDSVTAGSTTYVRRTIYEASGRVELRELGWNGSSPTLKVDYDYFAWNTPNGQGRLKQIKAGTPASPTSLLDLRYFSGTGDPAYDAGGNLITIYDHKMGSPQTHSFSYDDLDRLTSASVTGGSLGLYSENYTYDPDTGNLASKGGVSYYYEDPSHAHAVTRLGNGNTYGYDANGNMTQRNIGGVSYTLEYDAENRLTTVKQGATTIAAFMYDGDGLRVKGTLNGVTTAYVGEILEWTGSTSSMVKFYYAGSDRVAMKKGSTLYWLIGDHLSSTSVVANSSGGLHSKMLYKAWGEVRYASASLPTRYTYTGQHSYMDDPATPAVTEGFGLMFYRSRYYDPYLNRWISPDSIIPDFTDPQSFDRYSFVRNNPVNRIDPTGHMDVCPDCGGGSLEQTLAFFSKYGKHGSLFNEYYATVFFAEEVFAESISDGVIDDEEMKILATYEEQIRNTFKNASAWVPQSEISLRFLEEPRTAYAMRANKLGIKGEYVVETIGAMTVVITWGHGERHLISTSFTQQEVEAAIKQQIETMVNLSSSPPGQFWGRVTVRGTVIEYRAYPYGGGYHVGTYYEPRNQP